MIGGCGLGVIFGVFVYVLFVVWFGLVFGVCWLWLVCYYLYVVVLLIGCFGDCVFVLFGLLICLWWLFCCWLIALLGVLFTVVDWLFCCLICVDFVGIGLDVYG